MFRPRELFVSGIVSFMMLEVTSASLSAVSDIFYIQYLSRRLLLLLTSGISYFSCKVEVIIDYSSQTQMVSKLLEESNSLGSKG